MYLKISKKHFYNALSIVSRAISSYSPLPAFSGIKIDATANELILTGSDSDISIQTKMIPNDDNKLIIQDPGCIVIEAKYILDIIRKLDSDIIEFEIFDAYLTKISNSVSEFKINGIQPLEYPEIDFSKPNQSFMIEKNTIKKMIQQTNFATSEKEAKPVLMGINMHLHDHVLDCTGTDSYRLAKKIIQIDSDQDFNITIPSKTLNEIYKILDDDGNIQVFVNDKKIQFVDEHTIIQSRLIDGLYPQTSRLIPNNFEYELVIDSHDLLSAIDRASFIKSDGVYIIRFDLSEAECVMRCESAEVGSSLETLNSASFTGKNLTLSCNGKYVFDAVRALDTQLIKFKFCGDMKPFVIVAVDKEDVIQLVLPVRTY